MGLRKISSIRLCVRMCGMHGAGGRSQVYGCVCEDVWHAWG